MHFAWPSLCNAQRNRVAVRLVERNVTAKHVRRRRGRTADTTFRSMWDYDRLPPLNLCASRNLHDTSQGRHCCCRRFHHWHSRQRHAHAAALQLELGTAPRTSPKATPRSKRSPHLYPHQRPHRTPPRPSSQRRHLRVPTLSRIGTTSTQKSQCAALSLIKLRGCTLVCKWQMRSRQVARACTHVASRCSRSRVWCQFAWAVYNLNTCAPGRIRRSELETNVPPLFDEGSLANGFLDRSPRRRLPVDPQDHASTWCAAVPLRTRSNSKFIRSISFTHILAFFRGMSDCNARTWLDDIVISSPSTTTCPTFTMSSCLHSPTSLPRCAPAIRRVRHHPKDGNCQSDSELDWRAHRGQWLLQQVGEVRRCFAE